MTTLALGLLVGLAVGCLGERLRRRLPKLRRRSVSVIDMRLSQEELDDINRRYAESEVENRREVLDQQLSQFADQLAGDDELLRERLRRLERGAAS